MKITVHYDCIVREMSSEYDLSNATCVIFGEGETAIRCATSGDALVINTHPGQRIVILSSNSGAIILETRPL